MVTPTLTERPNGNVNPYRVNGNANPYQVLSVKQTLIEAQT